MRLSIFGILASILLASTSQGHAGDVPVFKVMPAESTVTFDVEASVASSTNGTLT
jgi:hypothetical protein